MHELVMAQSVLRAVLAEAARKGARRITAIDLDIGVLEGLRRDTLTQAFEVEAAGTIARGARLRITDREAEVSCTSCGRPAKLPPPVGRDHAIPLASCEVCGSDLAIRNGRGFVIRSATLDVIEPERAKGRIRRVE